MKQRMIQSSSQKGRGKINKKNKTKLRLEDEVIVTVGRDRGKRGKILSLDLRKKRALVQGIHLAKKYSRPTQENPKPIAIQLEQPIAISNLLYYDKKNKKGRRLTYNLKDGGIAKANEKQRAMRVGKEQVIIQSKARESEKGKGKKGERN